jgi:hypothetical protein
MARRAHLRALARSHGFIAVAVDGDLGKVETPLFPPDWNEPDYLIVKTGGGTRRVRRPAIPVGLVDEVDVERAVVYLRGTVSELAHLPESLPLARGGVGGRRVRRSSRAL